jgi:hypothetical protein
MRTFFPLVALFMTLCPISAHPQARGGESAQLMPDAPSASLVRVSDVPFSGNPNAVSESTPAGAADDDLGPDLEQLGAPPRNFTTALLVQPVVRAPKRATFEWENAARQSFLLLSVQHGVRMLQPKTRAQLDGPFFGDYIKSIQGISGWGDGDGVFTNYLLHPGEGGIASWIFIQNSPRARNLEFDARSGDYWRSRLKAMGFAAAYSTQFEIGLYSEATIGNVGMTPGTSGWVDFIMTPVGGFAFTVAEDAVDRKLIRKWEDNGASAKRVKFYRSLLNPERSIANLLRFKAPWHRDTRPMPD